MAEFADKPEHHDLIVIGAGSGGIACAKRAGILHKADVIVFEKARPGGTCVNVGCVPKKVMFNTAMVGEHIHMSKKYGFTTGDVSFDWSVVKKERDALVLRLNGIYTRGLESNGIPLIHGEAVFSGPKEVTCNGKKYTADNILIACGGAPRWPTYPGNELAITSDGFFDLESLPKKAVVEGGGYIGVELGGILHALGTDTTIVARSGILKWFDTMLQEQLVNEMNRTNLNLVKSTVVKAEKKANGLMTITLANGDIIDDVDCLIAAIGRVAETDALNLPATGITPLGNKRVKVDDFEETEVKGVFAIGDVIGKAELTPVAIAAGRKLADRIFGKMTHKMQYDFIPTVVFSHPNIGTCGFTEKEAVEKYGENNLTVYTSNFYNLYFTGVIPNQADRQKTAMKLICLGEEQRVIGLHCFGMGSDEILQGFGVAMKLGATKMDFDTCVAIHPTAAEELVTMGSVYMAGKRSVDDKVGYYPDDA